jgi:hypothetical protein
VSRFGKSENLCDAQYAGPHRKTGRQWSCSNAGFAFSDVGELWREAVQASRTYCQMVEQGDHLQRVGLREIVGIAYQMNLGKRRHSEATLLKVLDEVKG